MRVAIVGLGGVGGYICANFVKAGIDVVGFARGKHLEAIKKDGLKIKEDENSYSVDVDARELSDADGYFDVVIFTTKSYDLEQSFNKIKNYIDKNSTIISFSNGVSNSKLLRELSSAEVVDGCVYILSHIKEYGVIRKKGKVFLAVFGKNDKLIDLFTKANLRFKTPENILEAIWKKYIFISAFATLTSYYDKPISYIYNNHKDEAKELLNEIASVADAIGIDIFDEVEKSLQSASKVPADSSTSMHLDFKNGKKTELETLSGYIVKEAKRVGVLVPLMQKIYKKLKKT